MKSACSLACLAFLCNCRAFTTNQNSRIRTKALQEATTADKGWIKTINTPATGPPLKLGDIATLKYSCYLPDSPDEPSFSKGAREKFSVGDTSMIAGWDQALRTMSIGERSIIRITNPELGYGSKGSHPVVPPNAVIELDIEVLDSQPATANIDFDSLAMADTTPRTAKDIAAAFEARQASKAGEKELEGLEGIIAKVKGFYFFGLFEGETGQQAPWFLRPSITFPIAFAVVGAAFYVSFIGGAIYERGVPVQDELDEFVTMMSGPVKMSALLSLAL